jgi:hypothetical protein
MIPFSAVLLSSSAAENLTRSCHNWTQLLKEDDSRTDPFLKILISCDNLRSIFLKSNLPNSASNENGLKRLSHFALRKR